MLRDTAALAGHLVFVNTLRAALVIASTACVLMLCGCQSVTATCAAGLEAGFRLTVTSSGPQEPDIQYCALGRCSPRPTPGPIPRVRRDPRDVHAATVIHLGRGQWTILPRGTGPTPDTATIRLYQDGTLIGTRVVHLHWLPQDPCAATNPPNPHPTVTE